MASNSPNSPRQKMINLMYLVFIAMLALNVSSEVLDGFALVEASMLRSVKASSEHNDRIFNDLVEYQQSAPDKAQQWYDKGKWVKQESDSLFNYIQELKQRIVVKADGKDGNPEQLKHPDDLNAAYDVLFERGKNDAAKLRTDIDFYRDTVAALVTNQSIKNIIQNNLSTEPSKKAQENKQSWEESMFWQMPVAAAVTLLTKLQNDIRYAEGQVLSDLVKNIDVLDYRVNKLDAYVVPETQTVMRGTSYRAHIGILARDSTQRPKIFVNGTFLDDEKDGLFIGSANTIGTNKVTGYVAMPSRDGGEPFKVHFSEEYYVIQPSATVAPVWMNVLYAGVANEVQIAVPGVASQNVSASISNGTLTHKSNDIWVATPKLGAEAVITVTAKMAGKTQEMARHTFRVRRLPDPTPYLNVTDADGNKSRFKGERPLPKAAFVAAENLNAAIDDGILDTPFTVVRFDLQKIDGLGFAKNTSSDGARFSQEQKEVIRGAQRGQTVYIRGIVVRGPEGAERTLITPMEIRIN